MVRLVLTASSFLIGIFLICLIAEWLWGKGLVIVKPRSVLIYVNRPWWVEGIGLILFVVFSFTIVIEGSLWLFFPYAIPESLSYIGMIWVLTVVSIACAIYGELQDVTDDTKNNDNMHL